MASPDCVPSGFENVDPTLKVSGVLISGTTLTQGSTKIPALGAAWTSTAVANKYVTGLEFQYRVGTSFDASSSTDSTAKSDRLGWGPVTDGIIGGAQYAVRFRATGDNVVGPWTDPVVVTVPSDYVVGTAVSVDWTGLSSVPTALALDPFGKLQASQVNYTGNVPVSSLQPAQVGADVTSTNTSLDFTGRGALAKKNYTLVGSPTGGTWATDNANEYGFLWNPNASAYADDGMIRTSVGTAADFYQRGGLARLGSIGFDTSYLTGLPAVLQAANRLYGGTALHAGYIRNAADTADLNSYFPAEGGADVTSGHSAADFYQRGYLAKKSYSWLGTPDSGYGFSGDGGAGGLYNPGATGWATDAMLRTSIGTAADFYQRGGLARSDSASWSTQLSGRPQWSTDTFTYAGDGVTQVLKAGYLFKDPSTSIAARWPAELGSDITGGHTAADFSGRGALAKKNYTVIGVPSGNYWGSDDANSYGWIYNPNASAYADDGMLRTAVGTAADFYQRGALARSDNAIWSSQVSGRPAFTTDTYTYTANNTPTIKSYYVYNPLLGDAGGLHVYWPAEGGADVTGGHTAADFSLRGTLARQNSAAWSTQLSGMPAYATDVYVHPTNGTPTIRSGYVYNPAYGATGSIEAYWPAEGGSDVTGSHTASDFSGRGAMAKKNYSLIGSPVGGTWATDNGNEYGFLWNPTASAYGSDAMLRTSVGTSADFYQRGAFARKDTVSYGTTDIPGLPGIIQFGAGLDQTSGGMKAGYIVKNDLSADLNSWWPQDVNSNNTEARTAYDFNGRGTLAKQNSATWGSQLSGMPVWSTDTFTFSGDGVTPVLKSVYLFNDENTSIATRWPAEAGSDVTGGHSAADFSGRGALAKQNAVVWGGSLLSGMPDWSTQTVAASDGSPRLRSAYLYNNAATKDLETYFPQDVNSNNTEGRTAGDFSGRGYLAKKSYSWLGTPDSGYGYSSDSGAAAIYNPAVGWVTDSMVRTSVGVASDYSGRGLWANYSSLTPSTVYGQVSRLQSDGYIQSNTIYKPNVGFLSDLFPAENGCDVTGGHTAADFSGRGNLAKQNTATWGTDFSGMPQWSTDVFNTIYGVPAVKSGYVFNDTSVSIAARWPAEYGSDVTGGHSAADFSGRGNLAKKSYLWLGTPTNGYSWNEDAGAGAMYNPSTASWATDGMLRTAVGTAADFYQRGALARSDNAIWSSQVSGRPAFTTDTYTYTANNTPTIKSYYVYNPLLGDAGGLHVYWPAEGGADVTGGHTAADFSLRGTLARQNSAAWSTQLSGMPAYATDVYVHPTNGTPTIRSGYVYNPAYGATGSIEAYWPAEGGSDVTGSHTASDFSGRGAMAKKNYSLIGSPVGGTWATDNGNEYGFLWNPTASAYGSDAMLRTSVGTSADFYQRGAFARKDTVSYGTTDIPGLPGIIQFGAGLDQTSGGMKAGYIVKNDLSADLNSWWPQDVNSNNTEARTAYDFNGRGTLAKQNSATWGSQLSGMPVWSTDTFTFSGDGVTPVLKSVYLFNDENTSIATRWPAEAGSDVTGGHSAADFSGRGALAKQNAVVWGGSLLSGMPDWSTQTVAASDGSPRLRSAYLYNNAATKDLETYFPQDVNSNNTEGRTAGDFSGRGYLAKKSYSWLGTPDSGYGYSSDSGAAAIYNPAVGWVTDSMVRTSVGVASDYSGRGLWANYSSLTPSTVYGQVSRLQSDGYIQSNTIYKPNVGFLSDLFPAENGCDVTGGHTAADFSGRGNLAKQNTATWGTDFSGMPQWSTDVFNTIYGVPAVKSGYVFNDTSVSIAARWPAEYGSDVTGGHSAADFSGRGNLAKKSYLWLGTPTNGYSWNEDAGAGAMYNPSTASWATDGMLRTAVGTAADFANRGALATQSYAYPSNLYQGTPDNILPDPLMKDATWWTAGGGATGAFGFQDMGSGWGSAWAVPTRMLLGFGIGGNPTYDFFSRLWQVEPGVTYKIHCRIETSGDFNGWFNPVIHMPSVEYFSLITGTSIGDPSGGGGITTAGYGSDLEFIWSCPSTVTSANSLLRQIQFRFAGGTTAGGVGIGNLWMTKMTKANESLVDEYGTQRLVNSDIITNQGSAADFSGRGAWARFTAPVARVQYLNDYGRIIDGRGLPVNVNLGYGYTFNPAKPLSSSSTSSISVAAVTVNTVGYSFSIPSGTLSGLSTSTIYAVFWDTTTSSFVAINTGATGYYLDPSRYVALGNQSTQDSGGGYVSPPSPPGGGGGGGGNGNPLP